MQTLIKTVQLLQGQGKTKSKSTNNRRRKRNRMMSRRIMTTKRSKNKARMSTKNGAPHFRILIKVQANHTNKNLKGTLLKAGKLVNQAVIQLQATLVLNLNRGAFVVTVSPFEALSDTKLRGYSKRKSRLKTSNKMSKVLHHPIILRKKILFLRQASKKKLVNCPR